MSDTLIELKPCPFCGGAGELHPSALSAFTRMAFVGCVDCGCRSMASHYDNPGFMPQHIVKAAENWNNRLDEKELADARAEIEKYKAGKVAPADYYSMAEAEEKLCKELAEARAEVERLALEIENKQYTITCASEENQQLKESLAGARAEIERLKATTIDASLLREKLAELAHDQWVGWMEYLFSKSKQVDGCVVIPAWANERWRRQVATRYADLSEEEKDSDRSEADKFLAVFNAQLAEARAEIERLKEYTTCTLVSIDAEMDDKDVEIAERDKLIEQMRETLRLALTECRSTHCENEVKAALSAAERMNK